MDQSTISSSRRSSSGSSSVSAYHESTYLMSVIAFHCTYICSVAQKTNDPYFYCVCFQEADKKLPTKEKRRLRVRLLIMLLSGCVNQCCFSLKLFSLGMVIFYPAIWM